MISRNRRNRQRPPASLIMLGLAVLLLLSGFFFRSDIGGIARGVFFLASPGGQALQGEWRGFAALFSNKASLEAENARLRQELASSASALLDRNALFEENETLKRMLGRQSTSTASILGRVLLRPPGVPYDTLLVDAGLLEGVREGDLAVAGSAVIGFVDEVSRNSSRVELISASGQEHAADLRLQSGAVLAIRVEGQGGGSMRSEVPSGTQVLVGDEVVISGPRISHVGTVSHIEATEGSSFLTLYMHLPVNIFELSFIELLRSPASHEN